MRSFKTLLAIGECLDWWHLKIDWNRKAGLVDLQKSHFFENYEEFRFFCKIRNTCFEFLNLFLSICRCLKMVTIDVRTCFLSRNFDILELFLNLKVLFDLTLVSFQWITLRALPPVMRLTVHWRRWIVFFQN